ncbi:hypothetical protein C3L33_22614, partial [Rhododendron williamsianum]
MARTVVGPPAVVAYALTEASNWWDQINESPAWQDRIFHVLAALYGVVAVVALVAPCPSRGTIGTDTVESTRVWLDDSEVPQFTAFELNMGLVSLTVRCLVFIFRRDVQKLQPEILQHVLLDIPSLAFFTTYALLVLFWAEIYYQARAVSTDTLRPSFYTINAIVYTIQVKILLHTSTLFVRKGKLLLERVNLF